MYIKKFWDSNQFQQCFKHLSDFASDDTNNL